MWLLREEEGPRGAWRANKAVGGYVLSIEQQRLALNMVVVNLQTRGAVELMKRFGNSQINR